MKNVVFLKSSLSLEGLPKLRFPEIVFWGRSNVGKSSIINAITNNKGLAKTSKAPGRTRALNFFIVSEKFYIVDLPGYGYAKASMKEIIKWNQLIFEYLQKKRVSMLFLLIDSRHGIKENDAEIIEFLNSESIPFKIVLTKVDKISKLYLEKTIASVQVSLSSLCAYCYPNDLILDPNMNIDQDRVKDIVLYNNEILTSSIKNKDGINRIKKSIFSLL